VLRAVLDKALGSFHVQVAFDVPRGSTLVLVGESGAGKSTVLRLIAGLDNPDLGSIVVNDRPWYESDARTAVPAWEREVGYVPQDFALFPHLSVFENVAFGLRSQGLGGAPLKSRVGEALERVGVPELVRRRPDELSGGQRQRVALARALVTEPRVLLLDEPLSALDLATRRALRADLRRALSGLSCATVYVTHAPMEAAVFGDRILVLEEGRPTQTGDRDELLRHPKSAYVAEFMGVNLFRGAISFRDHGGLAEVAVADRAIRVVDPGGEGEVFAAVGPRDVTLHLEKPAGSALNVFHGPVEEIVPEPPYGERLRVALGTRPPLVAEITRRSAEVLGLEPGKPLYASFKASSVVTYR
jgi:molybdate transport system ATP-binding protein